MAIKIPMDVISGSKLFDRWDMDEKQFVFILLTDKLRTARKYDWIIPHEYESGRYYLFDTFVKKHQPIADYTFCAQDVRAMEGKYPDLLNGTWKEKVISVRKLKDNWGLKTDEVENVIDNSTIKPVDPNGDEISPMDISSLIGEYNMIDVEDLLYHRSEVAEIEKKYSIKAKSDTGTVKKLRHDKYCRLKCREIAEKLWQKDSEITIADMSVDPEINEYTKKLNGKYFTDTCVYRWISDLCPNPRPGRPKLKKST